MFKIETNSFKSITENQLVALESFLKLLNSVKVLPEHHLMHKQFYDIVTAYKICGSGEDSQWLKLYDVEGIVILNKKF